MKTSDMKLTPSESEACERALSPVGEYVGRVGMDKALQDYTREEALGLVIEAYKAVYMARVDIDDQEVEFK